jgi:hypothetical protein
LAPPGGRLKGIREVLRLVHNFAVAKFHDAYSEGGSPLVVNGVFRDPEIAASYDSPDIETGWLAGVMAA